MKRSSWKLFAQGGVLISLDQLFKFIAFHYIPTPIFINHLLGIEPALNREAIFSIPVNFGLIILVSFCLILLLIYLLKRQSIHPSLYIPFIMIISGGTSNLIDRVFRGYVVDYIRLGGAYFNLADVFILIGAVIIVVILIIPSRHVYIIEKSQ